MLMLTRKTNESILVGNNIEIKLLAVEGEKVGVGIEAPCDIDIYREEIYRKIKSNEQQSFWSLIKLTKENI